MEKFSFGQYDSSISDGPFQNGSYPTNTNGEVGAKKQLSYPLKELKEFINKTVSVKNNNGVEKAVQLKVDDNLTLKYRENPEDEFSDLASSGHIIFGPTGGGYAQRTKLKFLNTTIQDDAVNDMTIVNGVKGDKGDKGDQGVQGNTGATGPQGIQGPQGETGPQGATGLQGPTGPQGPVGSTGPTGPQGPQGIQGLQGPKGDKGDSGSDFVIRGRFNTKAELTALYPEGSAHSEWVGWAYFIGPTNTANPIYLWNNNNYEWENVGQLQGPQGIQGATGPQGETGATGATGPQGPQGDQGIQGPQGETGAKGEDGAQGPQGVQGPKGDTGDQGPQGIQGPKGDDGEPGVGFPSGGTAGQVLAKNSAIDYDTIWTNPDKIPTGGTTGQYLKKKSNTDFDLEYGDLVVDQELDATSSNAIANKAIIVPQITVKVVEDCTLTCTKGSKTLTVTTSGLTGIFKLPDYGIWTISDGEITDTVNVEVVKDYTVNLGAVMGISRSTSSNSASWTRTDDSIGKTATASIGTTAGHSDFDDMPIYKSITRITKDSGDVMVRIPKFYYRRYVENGNEYIKIAPKQYANFKLHPAFMKGNTEVDYFEIGAYKTTSGHFSKSGFAPLVNLTRASFRTNAKSKGTGWGIIDMTTLSAIQMLIMVEYAHNNVQSLIGMGKSSGSGAINTGGTDSMFNLGNHTGRESGTDNSVNCIWRGIESFWGNVWEWTDGLNWNNGTYYICNNPDNYADDTSTNYTALSYTGSTGWSQSFISEMGLDTDNEWCMMPKTASGSDSTYYCDAIWSSTGWRVFVHGGDWVNGTAAGLFASAVDNASSAAYANVGSRLLYVPLS